MCYGLAIAVICLSRRECNIESPAATLGLKAAMLVGGEEIEVLRHVHIEVVVDGDGVMVPVGILVQNKRSPIDESLAHFSDT